VEGARRAVLEARASDGGSISVVFQHRLNILGRMFDYNPSWGPLRVLHCPERR
jgi:hypothetical protein